MSKKKPKQAGICARKRHNRTYYFAEVGGKQVGLGCDLDAAKAKYAQKIAEHVERAKLASQVQAAEAKPVESAPAESKPVLTVRAVLFAFLEWCEKKRAPGTFKFYLRAIAGDATESQGYVSFDEYLTQNGKSELPAANLNPADLESWIDDHFASTSGTYKHNLIRSVQRAYNWAASGEGKNLLAFSPIKKVDSRPTQTPRKTFISDEQWATVLAHATGNLRDLLEVMHDTGARPAEVRAVESKHFDRVTRKWFFEKPVKKTNGTQEPRIVWLTDRAFEICERLAAKHPTGKLFRNERGEAWTKNALVLQCRRLSKKLDIKFSAVTFRHSFCTAALLKNHSPAAIAQALGHKTPEMVIRQYNQVGQCPSNIQAIYGINRQAGAA